jgi:hypothetical protein
MEYRAASASAVTVTTTPPMSKIQIIRMEPRLPLRAAGS